ncbi:MAG: hypothetical protein J6W54_03425 [Fibrobacter sp.]|uniref:hypothetical protein n=1 Tax=Fibrobacter sp. TaxID=35828 RepID=UPI001B191716|nr:hypothetical protein [Fibrobacter sp.]MBO7060134.1 hypothetical protein [Fibrobacter sp.]
MDITGLDIGALVAGIGAVIKSFHSDRKSDSAKKSLDERMSVIENDIRHHDKRLDDGDSNFKILDQKIDRNNELLNQLIGEVRAGRK